MESTPFNVSPFCVELYLVRKKFVFCRHAMASGLPTVDPAAYYAQAVATALATGYHPTASPYR